MAVKRFITLASGDNLIKNFCLCRWWHVAISYRVCPRKLFPFCPTFAIKAGAHLKWSPFLCSSYGKLVASSSNVKLGLNILASDEHSSLSLLKHQRRLKELLNLEMRIKSFTFFLTTFRRGTSRTVGRLTSKFGLKIMLLSIYPSVCRPVCPFVHPPIRPSVRWSVCPPSVLRLSSVCPTSVLCLSSVCPPSVLRLSSVCPPSVLRLSSVCPPLFIRRLGPSVFLSVSISALCPSVHLPVHLSNCLFFSLFFHPSICLSVWPSLHFLSVCLYVRPSIFHFVHLSICSSAPLSIFPSDFISAYQSL